MNIDREIFLEMIINIGLGLNFFSSIVYFFVIIKKVKLFFLFGLMMKI